jgi:hypothetical protein
MTLSAEMSRKQTNPSKTGTSIGQRLLRVLLALAILLVLVAGTGLLYQAIASAVDASRYPPPGRLVDVGGYRLHLHCTGTHRASRPTVILDAGLGGSSLDWRAWCNRQWRPSHVCASAEGPLPRDRMFRDGECPL